MIPTHQPADSLVHQAARRLAWRCVGIIENLLRQEEFPEAAREFYLVAREDMEKLKERLQGQLQAQRQ